MKKTALYVLLIALLNLPLSGWTRRSIRLSPPTPNLTWLKMISDLPRASCG